MDCEICDFETYAKENVFETEHWIVTLAGDDQSYLGRAYVKLRRHCGDLADLTESEWNDLQVVIRRYEKAAKAAFGACPFNWACLMNGAFQHANPSPHVHFHVRPRYASSVEFAGERFYDKEFGHHYVRNRKAPSDEVVGMILNELKRNDKG